MTEDPSEPRAPLAGGKREVRLPDALQAALLEQMREEQEASMRNRAIINWVLLPIAIACVVLGTAFMLSDDFVLSFVASTVASGVGWVLWRVNRKRIREALGR